MSFCILLFGSFLRREIKVTLCFRVREVRLGLDARWQERLLQAGCGPPVPRDKRSLSGRSSNWRLRAPAPRRVGASRLCSVRAPAKCFKLPFPPGRLPRGVGLRTGATTASSTRCLFQGVCVRGFGLAECRCPAPFSSDPRVERGYLQGQSFSSRRCGHRPPPYLGRAEVADARASDAPAGWTFWGARHTCRRPYPSVPPPKPQKPLGLGLGPSAHGDRRARARLVCREAACPGRRHRRTPEAPASSTGAPRPCARVDLVPRTQGSPACGVRVPSSGRVSSSRRPPQPRAGCGHAH